SGAESATPSAVRFNRDIRPILSSHCFQCHGPDLKKGGLNLQDRASATKELKSGVSAVVPGQSAASALIERVTQSDEELRMPPRGKGERLGADEVAKLRA